jgi:hypothetical protein
MGSGQSKLVAQEVNEQEARIDERVVACTVDRDVNVVLRHF